MRLIRRLAASVRRVLNDPATVGLDLDSVETTSQRRALIESKRFLRQLYDEWYALIAAVLPPGLEPVLEIGSGGGFLAKAIDGAITSDVLAVPGVDIVCDATHLPFRVDCLRGMVMTNVLHHVQNVSEFLREAIRCTKPGGVLAMVEPWVTPWSRWIYGSLHHEPFDPESKSWTVPPGGPLSGANGALPWIVFERDRRRFDREFPELRIVSIQPIMPLRYLLSGGLSMRPLAPAWSFRFWRRVDHALAHLLPGTAMFALIVVQRGPCQGPDGSSPGS